MTHKIPLLTAPEPPDGTHTGDTVFATAITAANILKDIREHITNTFGGEMTRYEELVDQTLERAFDKLRNRAVEQGYDGICSLRIANPVVVDGAVEIIVYGTGFRHEPTGGQESATS